MIEEYGCYSLDESHLDRVIVDSPVLHEISSPLRPSDLELRAVVAYVNEFRIDRNLYPKREISYRAKERILPCATSRCRI